MNARMKNEEFQLRCVLGNIRIVAHQKQIKSNAKELYIRFFVLFAAGGKNSKRVFYRMLQYFFCGVYDIFFAGNCFHFLYILSHSCFTLFLTFIEVVGICFTFHLFSPLGR
jgi:hypothetical protein